MAAVFGGGVPPGVGEGEVEGAAGLAALAGAAIFAGLAALVGLAGFAGPPALAGFAGAAGLLAAAGFAAAGVAIGFAGAGFFWANSATVSFIASSIGIRATPLALSTQP